MKISRGSFVFIDVEILNSNETLSLKKYHRRREALKRRAENSEARACAIVRTEHDFPHKRGTEGGF